MIIILFSSKRLPLLIISKEFMTITNKGGYRISGGKLLLLHNVDCTTNRVIIWNVYNLW